VLLRRGADEVGDEAPLVAVLLGIDAGARYGPAPDLSPQQRRARTLAALVAQLLGLAHHHGPVLMVLEDAHWADPTTLELLGQALVALKTLTCAALQPSRIASVRLPGGNVNLMVILIVEDELIVGLALKVVLFVGGYQVIGPAASADEALQLAEADPPDLAFVDINIVGDVDGVVVARALAQRHGTSSIFLTAQLDTARNARDAAIGVMGKPYDPPALLDAVKIAAAIRKGEPPATMPGRLELFH
jgi:CheY-like chemotaxis protein